MNSWNHSGFSIWMGIEASPLEFLAKLSIHIPNTHERTTRLYEQYSYRSRGVKNREEKFKTLIENNFEPLEEIEQKRKPCRYWATYIKKVYEVDPLICKRCGAEMKIKRLWPAAMSLGHAVFTATQKLRKSLKLLILKTCLLYTSPSPRDLSTSRMPSSA